MLTRVQSTAARALALLIAAAIALAGAGCGVRETAFPAGTKVLIIGDSITAGLGVEPAQAWPAQLAALTDWRVIAAGVNGDRSVGGRDRLPALLDEHAPALVIVELGGNDMLRGVQNAQTAANLQAMVETVRGRDAKVVLMAVPQPNAIGALVGLSPAKFYVELRDRMKVPLIEKALPSVLSDASLKLDAIHPNVEGHQALAERARAELSSMGFVPRR